MVGFQNSMRKNSWQKPRSIYEMNGEDENIIHLRDGFGNRLTPFDVSTDEGLSSAIKHIAGVQLAADATSYENVTDRERAAIAHNKPHVKRLHQLAKERRLKIVDYPGMMGDFTMDFGRIADEEKIRNVLSEGPIWGEGSWEDVIRDQSIPSPQNAPLAPINYNSYGETSPISVGRITSRPYSNLLNRQPGSENQGGSITSEQYTQYAYNAIMGIMQDAADQGIIDSGSISQLAGQAFATWVTGGPSALANFLTQNNIPFPGPQRD
jgi:hypothetical protein